MKAEAQEEHLQQLKTYLTHTKLSKTVDRNLLMVESYEKKLGYRTGEEPAAEEGTKKKAKPDDLVKVYETLIQNMTEIIELGADEPESAKENAARIYDFKATRCFYLAMSYSFASRWNEALALFDRASEQMAVANEHYKACKNVSTDILSRSQEIESKIRGYKAEAHAKGFLEGIQAKKDAAAKESTAESNGEKSVQAPRSLHLSISEFDGSFAANRHVIAFPPDLEPIKCKPTLFDLAFGGITFPSLEAKKQQQGKAGGFWGFFGYKQ
eukprot:TRINITY_DN5209_c0_g1_i1.p1 TRINITY_DN5209_c0_g1~~TRINITY_DN5209_c0_g1_i1.p1  ORF type:complete len:269 (-),score=109.93 TRINITY_DN5209_c0_g1_i1:11-817(-)